LFVLFVYCEHKKNQSDQADYGIEQGHDVQLLEYNIYEGSSHLHHVQLAVALPVMNNF
jgi:hypothetical protein